MVIILRTRNLTKRFGGLTAVNKVNLEIGANNILGIIGPNGAGKTTLINLITGYFIPDEGAILYKDTDITRMPAHKRIKIGIVRTFQLVSVFNELTVFQNVVLALVNTNPQRRSLKIYVTKPETSKEIREEVERILEMIGALNVIDKKCGELSYGYKRKVEVAMALALRPRVLFVDEPFSGLSESEIPEMISLFRRIMNNGIEALVMVEHKISWIMNLVDRLVVMHEGNVIAEGRPDKVIDDPAVQEAYWKYIAREQKRL